MKKTLIIFTSILAGLFIVLSLMGLNSEYAAEKQIWKINQEFSQISKDPKSAPDAAYEKVINDYNKFINRFGKSKILPIAYLLKGRVYVAKDEYERAREVFEEVITRFPDDTMAGVRALTDIGKTYALQKDDDNIIKTYERILQKYPLTDVGLSTPLLIAKFYADKKQPEKAQRAFNEAVSYYKNLIDEHPKSTIEFYSLRLLAACYMAQGKWQESVNTFEEILTKFSKVRLIDMRTLDSIVKSINTISVAQLNSFDIPINIYKKFIDNNPGHPFNNIFEKMINTMQNLKEEKLKTQVNK